MAKKIEISGKALLVTDTVSGLVELAQPPVRTWYKEDDLKNGRISFYDLDSTEDVSGNFTPIALSDAVDGSLVAFTESTFRTFCLANLGFNLGGSSSLPTADIFHGGFVDYNDLATATTPIPFIADTEITLTNDGLGVFTNKTNLPTGVTDIWNTTTNKFDFTQLKLGDMIDIRVDLNVTTGANNQSITISMHLAEGASEYTIPLISQYEYKVAGTRQVITYNGVYMGDNNTLNNPAELHLLSDKAGSVIVNGWFCKIIRKG